MSAIIQAIDKLASTTYLPQWSSPSIKQYVLTGDEALLMTLPMIRSGGWELEQALPDPDQWNDEATRVIKLAVKVQTDVIIDSWLQRYCCYHCSKWQFLNPALDILRKSGTSEWRILKALHSRSWLVDWDKEQATPAGELLLEFGDDFLVSAINNSSSEAPIVFLLARYQPARLPRLLEGGLSFRHSASAYAAAVRGNPELFHKAAREQFPKVTRGEGEFTLASALGEHCPAVYGEWASDAIRELFSGIHDDDVLGRCCSEYLLKHPTPDTFKLINRWMSDYEGRNPWNAPHQRELVLEIIEEKHPSELASAAEACTFCKAGNVKLMGIKWWKKASPNDTSERSHAAIQRVLADADSATLIAGITEARNWNLHRTAPDLWPLMQHKSRPVRGAAARSLAALGFDVAQANGAKLLEHKKAEIRQAAVVLFATIGGDEATRVLKARLDVEENDDVRDDILLALERNGGGAVFTAEELQARIAKTLAKVKGPPVAWVDVGGIKLQRTDGSQLSADEVLYLLHRQSRCKDMRADLEAKPMFASLDRAACSDSALALWQAFMGSGQSADDRWALAFVALTGDDRLVPPVHRAILDWADKSRGKLAEYGAQALALLGTEAALMVVESLSVRFRSKNKNIGKAAADAFAAAAEARGVSVEELGDLVVPWLGFEAGRPRIVQAGKAEIEVRIDSEFKLSFRDTASGKKLAKLPPAASAETQAEFKALAGTVKEALKAQLLRIETLLVRQFRWPVARWRELYLAHPLLRPFTQRLVWSWRGDDGVIGHTFRALDDGSLTDVNDDTVELPDQGVISLVHPLELDDAQRSAWVQHLVDYKIDPPFPQLNRPVVRVKEDERAMKFGKQVEGADVNAMSFRGRAEKLGWTRGSVCDAGGVPSYRKVYSGAGVEAFLDLEGMYVGIGMEETIKLGKVCFVRSGSVQIGSYIYDDPSNEDDPRLIAFGDVPPVPFSETMGDLIKISGKTVDEAATTE